MLFDQIESEVGLHIPEVLCDRSGVEVGDVLFTLEHGLRATDSYATAVVIPGGMMMVGVSEDGTVAVRSGSVAKGEKLGRIDLLHCIV